MKRFHPGRSTLLWGGFAGLAAVLILAGTAISLRSGDGHYLARFGASIAAIGALLVIIQIRFEFAIDRKYQDLLRRIDNAGSVGGSPALDAVVQRLKQQSRDKAFKEFQESRISAAVIVAAIAAIGELLHGWGDMIIKYLR